MRVLSMALLCLWAMFAWVDPVHAAQSYDNCTGFITSLPAVINTQGTWCLKADLATAITSGDAITINANNVTIDCNDFKLGGLAAGLSTLATGISANSRANLTVRHCNIRGFYNGVELFGSASAGHLIEDSRFNGNTAYGINVDGDGTVIRRNQVADTGGSSLFIDAAGIRAAYSADILDNTISGVTARNAGGGSAYGIVLVSDIGGSISGNRIRGVLKDGAGTAYGIASFGSDRLAMHNNDLAGEGDGVAFYCASGTNGARDNMVIAFASAFGGCTDSGNTILP